MPKFTLEEIRQADNDHEGFCTDCELFTRDGCEPDAEFYDCPECGQDLVFGAMQAVICGHIDIV